MAVLAASEQLSRLVGMAHIKRQTKRGSFGCSTFGGGMSQSCPHRGKGRKYLKCQCPIWMDWRLDGPRLRRPVGTRNWEVAQRRAREWEAQGFADGGKTT